MLKSKILLEKGRVEHLPLTPSAKQFRSSKQRFA